MAAIKYLDLARFTQYDGLIKNYINTADAKAFKSAKFDETTRKVSLFKVETPAEGAVADFEFTIPEQDLTELQNAIKANEDAIKAINDENTGILKTAKDYADGKDTAIQSAQDAADKAQEEVDALELVVDAMYKNDKIDEVVADAKKAGTDAQTAVNTLAGKVGEVPEDKTVLDLIEEAKEAAVEGATYDDTKVKEDIQKNADAIALLNNNAETEGSVDYKIAQAVAAIIENPDETMNSINELVTWINGHAADALELSNKVTANEGAIADLEALVGEEGVAKQIEDAIAEALTVEGADKYALAADLTAAIARVATLEGKAHTHTFDEEVLNGITAEKVSAWDASEQNAKNYADGLAVNYDAAGSAQAAETNAKAAVTALENGTVKANSDAITALQNKVGDGMEAITEDEIAALFA